MMFLHLFGRKTGVYKLTLRKKTKATADADAPYTTKTHMYIH